MNIDDAIAEYEARAVRASAEGLAGSYAEALVMLSDLQRIKQEPWLVEL